MTVGRAEIDAAPEVESDVVTGVLGKPVIHTADEAGRVAAHIKSSIFKFHGVVHVTDDTKLVN